MSVYGGDSWGREANHRKRRVEDLMLEELVGDGEGEGEGSHYKKLSNGKYACLVCPNNPLFDSSLMLSIHNKGSRHLNAESRLKQRELMRQEEIKKRIVLSDGSVDSVGSSTSFQHIHQKGKQMVVANACSAKSKTQPDVKGKPLIKWTLKATTEALSSQNPKQLVADKLHNERKKTAPFFSPHSSSVPKKIAVTSQNVESRPCLDEQATTCVSEATVKMLAEHQIELVERHERELKFTAAGWKRDGHGRWYRDENVEFDSDEEDPNICLS